MAVLRKNKILSQEVDLSVESVISQKHLLLSAFSHLLLQQHLILLFAYIIAKQFILKRFGLYPRGIQNVYAYIFLPLLISLNFWSLTLYQAPWLQLWPCWGLLAKLPVSLLVQLLEQDALDVPQDQQGITEIGPETDGSRLPNFTPSCWHKHCHNISYPCSFSW